MARPPHNRRPERPKPRSKAERPQPRSKAERQPPRSTPERQEPRFKPERQPRTKDERPQPRFRPERPPRFPERPQPRPKEEPARAAAARPSERAPAAERPAEGGLWLYGRHAVMAALANPARRVRRLLALPETSGELRLLAQGAAARLPPGAPETLDRRGFEALMPPGAVHQGMALAAEPLPALDIEDVLDALADRPLPHVVVLLDQVSDPHNVGAVLRSAAAFAACAVVLPEHGAPPVTGALAKAASGALEAVPLLRVTNLARTLDRLKEAGFWCLGLEEGAERSLAETDPGQRVALVLGAEGSGLRRLTRERCDFLARLPTRGEPASLNVSNAAAIALYELTRRAP